MPSRNKSKTSISVERALERGLPLLALLALGGTASAHYYLTRQEAIRETISSVCDAIFIASFLAIVVDPVLKKGLLKEGIKSIFRYIYGYALPPSLQDFYERTVVGTKELRTDFSLHWRIKPLTSVQDLVAVRLHAKFRMLNFTNDPRSYNHRAFAVNDTARSKGVVESLYCTDLGDHNKSVYSWDKKKLAEMQADIHKKNKDLKLGYQYGPAMDLEPKNADYKERYLFGAIYSSEQSWPHGLDWFRFTEVTTQAEVTITVDEALKDHHFTVIPAPSDGSDGMKPTFDFESEEYRCHWNFARLFVPNEIIIVRWQPPETQVPLSTSLPQPAFIAKPLLTSVPVVNS
jgi:hypothetical protein